MDLYLSFYRPLESALAPGTRAAVRPAFRWAGMRLDSNEWHTCHYIESDRANTKVRSVMWGPPHVALVGREFNVVPGRSPSITLPTLEVPDGQNPPQYYAMHPDWLDLVGRPPPITECTCDLWAMMARGCTCGQMARERKEKAGR